MKKKIKVALINPPVAGHLIRGTGVYTSALYKELEKSEEMEVLQCRYGTDISGIDIVHYPYFDPFFLTLKISPKVKTVVTVHDLIPLKYPSHFPRGIRGTVKWLLQKRLLQKADGILTDSFASKKDIIDIADIVSNKIEVVYLGVDGEFKKIGSKMLLEKARRDLKLPGRFLLTVGDVNWNKNIFNLIRLFGLVNKKDNQLHLLLIGKGFVSNSPQLQEILELTRSLDLTDKVIRMGNLTLSDLVKIYNLAELFILPSYAEGFGLPLLEAFACQCPALVAHAGSLPELAGKSSVYLDPDNIFPMADRILEILNNSVQKQKMIDYGLKRVSEFSWQKCAGETLSFYKQVLA